MTKTCTTCKITKGTHLFVKDKKSTDGFQSQCKDCRNEERRADWRKNRTTCLAKRKIYRQANPDKIKEMKHRHYIKHKDSILLKCKEYVAKNKEARTKYRRKHYLENKHIYTINARKREGRLKQGINTEFMDRIKAVYTISTALSEADNVNYQVDHIIHLTNKRVSGLNVSWNLQILTEDDNRSKKNKFDGTYSNNSWRRSCHLT